jgi:uncharacterized protein (TIRG00374 family)
VSTIEHPGRPVPQRPPAAPRRSPWRDPRALVGLGVSALFLVLLLRKVDGAELRLAITEAEPGWFLLALVVYAGALVVRGERWRLVVSPHARISHADAGSLLVIGYAANNVLPVRAGEFVRAGLMQSRHRTPWTTVLGAIVVERVLDGLVLALFLSGTILLAGGEGAARTLAALGAIGFSGALVMLYAIALAGDRGVRLVTTLVGLVPVIGGRAAAWAGEFLDGLAVLRDLRLGLALLAATTTTWALEATAYWLVGHGFGLGLDPLVYLGICGAANLAIAAPSTAGGIGPFEFFARSVAVSLGAPAGRATVYALAVHMLVIVPVVLLGAVLLWRWNLGFGSLLATRQRAATSTTPVAGDGEG